MDFCILTVGFSTYYNLLKEAVAGSMRCCSYRLFVVVWGFYFASTTVVKVLLYYLRLSWTFFFLPRCWEEREWWSRMKGFRTQMGMSMPWRTGDGIKSRKDPRNPWQVLDRYANSGVIKRSSPVLNV